MKTFLKVIAWLGVGIVLLPMLYLYICWLVRISQPPPPYPTGGEPLIFLIIIPLVIIGFLFILLGGLIGKPKYFWIASLALGILYIGTFYPFIHSDIKKFFSQPINIHIDNILFIIFCIVPGLIAIGEGIILRVKERKIQGVK